MSGIGQSLLNYAAHYMPQQAPVGYEYLTVVETVVCLTPDGKYQDCHLRDTKTASPILTPRVPSNLLRATPPKTHFFIGYVPQVFPLLVAEPHDNTKNEVKRGLFLEQIRTVIKEVPCTRKYLTPIQTFLEDDEQVALVVQALTKMEADLKRAVIFQTEGKKLGIPFQDKKEWREWWATYLSGADKKKKTSDKTFRCVVTGDEITNPCRIHPDGIAFGTTKTKLVAAKQTSSHHYGQESGLVAPMSDQTASTMTQALVHAAQNAGTAFGDLRILVWACSRGETLTGKAGLLAGQGPVLEGGEWTQILSDVMSDLLNSGLTDGELRGATRKVKEYLDTGTGPGGVLDMDCTLGIVSSNGPRLAVRHWETGPLSVLFKNIYRWYQDMTISNNRNDTGIARLSALWQILSAVNGPRGKASELEREMLVQVALRGQSVPMSIVKKALVQFRSQLHLSIKPSTNMGIAPALPGILKTFINRRGNTMCEAGLNKDHPSVAYQCGRLLSVLSELQSLAIGGRNPPMALAAQFSSATMQNPARALARLLLRSEKHVNKLVRQGKGWADHKRQEIVDRLPTDLPTRLGIEDQALFAMGLLHQRSSWKKQDKPAGTPPIKA